MPLDIFSQSGLSAPVGDDGVLGSVSRYDDGEVTRHDAHSDTGTEFEDATFPAWFEMRSTVLFVAAALPDLSYVGWDVIATGESDCAIGKGDATSDTDLLQPHGPLLTDRCVRVFYAEHGIAIP